MADTNLSTQIAHSREFYHLADVKAYVRRIQRRLPSWQVVIQRHAGSHRRSDGTIASHVIYVVRLREPRS